MPVAKYIPDRAENPTVFPLASMSDFGLAARKVKEQWARFYPQVSYRRINVIPTQLFDIAAQTSDQYCPNGQNPYDKPSGMNTGGTLVDPLYDESVPSAKGVERWVQPHSSVDSPERNAEKHDQRMPPVQVHAFIRVEINDYVLKRWGIDEEWDIIAIFAAPELDEKGILISAGDRFLWQGQEYEVHQRKPDGWWMNTDLFLHVVTSCRRARQGS